MLSLPLEKLNIEIFADGADLEQIKALAKNPLIKGFTTNPTLMRKAGVSDYERFSRAAIEIAYPRSISLEVFADDLAGIRSQAMEINKWGPNVYVKVPVTLTDGTPTTDVVGDLLEERVKVNVTAITTFEQVFDLSWPIDGKLTPSYVSIFAGRVADTGRDPQEIVRQSVTCLQQTKAKIIWASPREVLNIIHAEKVGCHIITVTPDILGKLHLWGKDLEEYSLETVKMFREDAVKAAYSLRDKETAA